MAKVIPFPVARVAARKRRGPFALHAFEEWQTNDGAQSRLLALSFGVALLAALALQLLSR